MAAPDSALVLSIPAGDSVEDVYRFSVYACPARYARFDRAPLATFRRQGGVMDRVYRIQATVEVDETDPGWRERLNPAYRERVVGYLARCREIWPVEYVDRHRVLVLSEAWEQLPHQPRLSPNTVARCYFRLLDLRDRSRSEVQPARLARR
jgi:hypothetical protein